MLFHSFLYIFFFLPVATIIYFVLRKRNYIVISRWWLVVCSIVFYGWSRAWFVGILVLSITANYFFALFIIRFSLTDKKKIILFLAILFNIVVLGIFKYTDFFIDNLNFLAGRHVGSLNIILPLGISFYTFIQIAFLVDTYRGEIKENNFLNYIMTISFFPHLLSGPIIRYKNEALQFQGKESGKVNYKNIAGGLFVFSIGLFKKVLIADNLSLVADAGFNVSNHLPFINAWITSISYTLQLYFDFSGYTDMAVGSALIFNINLPINFNSPYKAVNIQDFWRRWHISLSTFLRDYIYIPLGGSRAGTISTYFNLMATFLVAGLWHGAGWTFLFWGFLHGSALIIHRLWKKTGIAMPPVLAVFITFIFLNCSWIFFRARSLTRALYLLEDMFFFWKIDFSKGLMNGFIRIFNEWHSNNSVVTPLLIFLLAVICFFGKNSNEQLEGFKPEGRYLFATGLLFLVSFFFFAQFNKFIYTYF